MSMRQAGLALAALLVVGLGAATPGDEPAAGKKGLKAMQGSWTGERNGDKSTWAFDKETVKTTADGQTYTSKVQVIEGTTPNELDLEITAGPADAVGLKFKAIYKFEGEKLLICVAAPGYDTRPSTFKEADGESWLYELKKD
jgi:uncharacterized protein (TIGR03067 family)